MIGVARTACSPSVRISLLLVPFQATVAPGLSWLRVQHQGSVVERREEQLRSDLHRRRDGHRAADRVGLPPVELAVGRIERDDLFRIPDDELPRAAGLDDDRLRDAEVRFAVERAPDLLAGHLVERHDPRVLRAADEADEPRAVDQRRAGEAPVEPPLQPVDAIVLGVVLAPEEFAGLHVERRQDARASQGVDAVFIDRRRRAGAGFPLNPRVVRLPFLGSTGCDRSPRRARAPAPFHACRAWLRNR